MMTCVTDSSTRRRLRIAIRGAVQGVGFRPYIYRLATEQSLTGWVNNSPQGVTVEVEGSPAVLQTFLLRVERERPPLAAIHGLEATMLDPTGYADFTIRESTVGGDTATVVLPDIAPCAECRCELFDPRDRRYRYPFINCTNCGPRYTIIEALPYDRPNTTMRGFALCPACAGEYGDPRDRRFHAQPLACPVCGPHLELWDAEGQALATHDDALLAAAATIRQGQIVAVKGIGGFQLLVDARNSDAVQRLRTRKHRAAKPLAVMYPTLAAIAGDCRVEPLEARLLQAPEAPIVLLAKRNGAPPAPEVAPGNPYLGAMLPSSPLHYLLLHELDFPVVATSGNLSDEPICIDEHEALARLRGIADVFLVHNRPIVRHVDDSLARVVLGRELVLRRARGYAPLPIHEETALPTILAVGAHLKNAVALAHGTDIVLSQHIGDLETAPAYDAFTRVATDLPRLLGTSPAAVACDLHPDYLATQYARASGLPVIAVQHHLAHVLACMAENELTGPVLGVAWDGTGYGRDGAVWGGEFLLVEDDRVTRVAHLRPFPLPGGDRAVREPRRSALGMLYAWEDDAAFTRELPTLRAFTTAELTTLRGMLTGGVNCPVTTSVGRLFDAVASLTGLCQQARYEGEAAMALEFAAVDSNDCYEFALTPASDALLLDWAPLLSAVLADLAEPVSRIAAKFHHALANAIVAVARRINCERIALSGGCFQNALLLTGAVTALRKAGFRPYWHQRVPPNDGGIALGQVFAAAQQRRWNDVSGHTR